MFSYLQGMRPNSRRSALPPATTPQHALSTRPYQDGPFPSSQTSYLPPPQRTPDTQSPSPVSPAPPILPPIPRVASRHDSDRTETGEANSDQVDALSLEPSSRDSQRPRSASQTSELRGIRPPGLGLKDHPHRTSRGKSTPSYSNTTTDTMMPPPPPQSAPVRLAGELYDPTRPSYNPLQNDLQGPTYGLPSISQSLQQPPAPPPPSRSPLYFRSNTNASKTGKAKLNLLNPMSLLARRRSSQRVAEASERS